MTYRKNHMYMSIMSKEEGKRHEKQEKHMGKACHYKEKGKEASKSIKSYKTK